MADIRQFLEMATRSLKIDNGTAKTATGGLLGFLGDQMDKGDFQALLGQLPGAEALLPSAAPAGAATAGGGLLGGLTKLAGGALGGRLGDAAGILAALQASGLKTDQIGGFVTQFLGFAKQNVSGDLFGKILSQVPDLQKTAK